MQLAKQFKQFNALDERQHQRGTINDKMFLRLTFHYCLYDPFIPDTPAWSTRSFNVLQQLQLTFVKYLVDQRLTQLKTN